MATGHIKGKNFKFYIEVNSTLTLVCYATDCIINQELSTLEISNPLSEFSDFLGDKFRYSLSVPGLINYINPANFVELENIYKSRGKFEWEAKDQDNGGVVHSGIALMTNLQLTSANRDVCRFSMEAVGCGPKETELLPIITTVYLADEQGIRLPGCPNPYPVTVFWYDLTPIGVANNNDDVVSIFNAYIGNLYYTLSVGISGCDFNLSSEWNAPFIPDFVIAEQTPGMVMSHNFNLDAAISPDQDNDEVLSPGYA